MNYLTGELCNVGDKVRLGNRAEGVVVCSIDTDEYTSTYPRSDWSYLGCGVMIEFIEYGLIYYQKADDDLYLIARAA